jgi:hypothetical protein
MKVFVTSVILFFSVLTVNGNEVEDLYKIKKTSDILNFDGICDEAIWDHANLLPMQMFRPNHGSQPTEKSEIFVTFDDQYFYFGGRMHYSNGATIKASTKKRDGVDGGSDNFGILLDTFNDNENGLCFETNPVGMRSDFSIANDAQVNDRVMPFNRSWNTFWDVKTKVEGDILHVEMRIPLSSLRFQEKDGKVIMGMSVWRTIISKQEWNVFPLLSNEFGTLGVWKPSQAQKIVLEGIKRSNPVYVTPYVLAGIEQTSEENEDNTGYKKVKDEIFNVGLDLKYALTSNLTMDVTINTDFAQVEVDDQMVNLTRFSIFFPEKRQFFLERSSIFSIKTGFFDQLFYSRRIGIYEDDIVPIYGGVRLNGREGKWDFGFLDMQTSDHEYYNVDEDSVEFIESTNYGVFRARRQVLNERSYAGGMITSKVDVNGNYNVNAAVDLIYNPFKNDYITANYIQTFDSDVDYSNNLFNHSKIFINWENRANVGFSYDFLFSRAGQQYDPQMGFELIEDYTRGFASLSHGWVYNQPEKKMLSQQVTLSSWLNKRNYDMVTDISYNALQYNFSMKNGYNAQFMLLRTYEDLDELFELSDDVYFDTGTYNYINLEASIRTPSNKLLAIRAMVSGGQYYDGTILTLGPAELTMRASAGMKFSLDYQYSQVDVNEREQYYKAHLVRFKTDFTFTTKLSLLMFFQYSSDDKFGVNNIRFRYNPKEGNDLYLVYNGEYNTHLTREIPELPRIETNTLLLKYTYTFIWGK